MELSPSIAHQKVISHIKPSLAYDGKSFTEWQRIAKAKVIELLRMPKVTPPKPTSTTLWKHETELGTIEKISFPAEDGSEILAYWCKPKNQKKPWTFICLQGHSSGMHNSIAVDREDETKPITVGGDGDFAIGCMKRGIAALCIEQRSFGLRREQTQVKRSQHPCHDAVGRALLIGRTLTGERVYDVDRGIDYLLSRNDVDPNGIGVLGHSGGGTTAMYAMSVLDRIKMGIVAGCFTRYADSIASISHCPCNVIPDIMLYLDAADILGVAAPRPLVIQNGEKDEIFPIDSARKHFPQLQKIYQAAGAGSKVKLAISPDGHRFDANLAWDAMESIT